MKPVIFLDIDGVLNNRGCYFPGNIGKFGRNPDQKCIAALNQILDATGAEIVVSSTWRYGRTDALLQEMLSHWGVRGRVIGATPTGVEDGTLIAPGMRRGHEIGAWLVQHPGVNRFVILDDDSDMAHLMHRLVQTRFDHGLTEEHAKRAIAMLSGHATAAPGLELPSVAPGAGATPPSSSFGIGPASAGGGND